MEKMIDCIKNVLQKQEEKVAQLNEAARIEMIFTNKLKPLLLTYIDNNIDIYEIHFERSFVTEENNNHDIRRDIDEDLLNLVNRKGYFYREDLSSPTVLVFRKGVTQYE